MSDRVRHIARLRAPRSAKGGVLKIARLQADLAPEQADIPANVVLKDGSNGNSILVSNRYSRQYFLNQDTLYVAELFRNWEAICGGRFIISGTITGSMSRGGTGTMTTQSGSTLTIKDADMIPAGQTLGGNSRVHVIVWNEDLELTAFDCDELQD